MAEKNEMFGQGCGCQIQGHGLVITYCPMHKAAEETLLALEDLLFNLDGADLTEPIQPPSKRSVKRAHEAVAQARDQEVGT